MADNIIYIGNSNVVELETLHDSISDAVITDATVTATMVNDSDVLVSGESWPISLSHDGGGTYRATMSENLVLVKNNKYWIEITATGTGGEVGYWLLKVTAADRES